MKQEWRNRIKWIDELIILASSFTGCISISAFTSLLGIPIGIMSSGIGLKICAITAGIKKYKTIILKEKKKHNKTVLLAKSKLNSLEELISHAIIDSNISHGRFTLINNGLKEYHNKKEEIKNLQA